MAGKIAFYIVIGIISALVLGIFVLLLYRLSKKSKTSFKGDRIEMEIVKNFTKDVLFRKIASFVRNGKYRHAVIYLFYSFRIFSKENLIIRNAETIYYKDLKNSITGFSNISKMDFEKFLVIYEKARFMSEEITQDDFFKMKELYTKFTGYSF
ncbi:MAG: hypothetical protein JXA54_09435 [Candidatus Heimdallarchaeota archaeon]|nr:hypothetical protein [Candidatus Heimdallarchaeota archaeon]